VRRKATGWGFFIISLNISIVVCENCLLCDFNDLNTHLGHASVCYVLFCLNTRQFLFLFPEHKVPKHNALHVVDIDRAAPAAELIYGAIFIGSGQRTAG